MKTRINVNKEGEEYGVGADRKAQEDGRKLQSKGGQDQEKSPMVQLPVNWPEFNMNQV